MEKIEFIRKVNRRVANVAVSPSAMRNQGKGVAEKCKEYFVKHVKLKIFFRSIHNEDVYIKYLDKHTLALMESFGESSDNWGASRKALNLYFRDVVYNRFLAEYYGLPQNDKKYDIAIQHLEIPLDSHVASKLCTKNSGLPKWVSIRSLDYDTSQQYQGVALKKAKRKGIARVHLDLIYWRHPTRI